MSGLILLLVRLVMSRASFSTFLQLPTASETLRIYVVRCFKLVAGILYCNFVLFYMHLFTAAFIK